MKIQIFLRRIAAFLIAAAFISCSGMTAFAYGAIDTSRETSLTVYFGRDGRGFSGVEFKLYHVADVSETINFTLTEAFAGYPIRLDGLDSSGWRALAQTLDGYVARDHLSPDKYGKTSQDGQVHFEHLKAGLYLVTGNRFKQGRYTYTPEPFLICLPTWNEETGQWNYDAAASCKYDSDYTPPGGGGDGDDDTVDRKVMKVWKDDGGEEKRPDEIAVQLLRDDEVYDTVTLNEDNRWKYEWTDLDKDYRWRVVEYETPEGYTVSVNRQGITFVMTNRWTTEIPDEPTPEGGCPPNTPKIPDGPVPKADGPRLPQTGVLWWPVPLLAGAGMLLFGLGWLRRRNEGRNE